MINKTKKFQILAAVALAAVLCGCGATTGGDTSMLSDTVSHSEEGDVEYPMIAYIDNVNYYGTGEICDMVPRKAPDGIIETFVDKEIMPDAPFSANFGQDQGSLEYMFLDDDQLIIHIGENWYYFK